MENYEKLERKFQNLIKEALELHFRKCLSIRQQEGRNNKKSKL